MLLKYFKISSIILLFFQIPLYSKTNSLNEFNSKNLSNYFSGIVAFENKENLEALKFFRSSKILINKHDPYLKRYVYSLVLEGKVQVAAIEIKQNLNSNNSSFFEAYLILSLESLKRGKFDKSKHYLEKSSKFINNDRFALIIYETLKQYLYVFLENKIQKTNKNFGNLSFINETFQRCYLEDQNTKTYFVNLVNNMNDNDYSRYIFFYINYLVSNNSLEEAKEIVAQLDYLNSTLLLSQSKKWVEEKKIEEFNKIFSCKNPNDIISEFFFLIANLYSSQSDYKDSNFYLNISHYLNPKFKFNLSLLVDNYYLNKDYKEAKKILEKFNKGDDFYYWFKITKLTQIISKSQNKKESLRFINSKFKKIKNPSIKMIFDMANFNKNSKQYKNAIILYNQIISKTDLNPDIYANILYRRGSSHERLGDYLKSDKDFLLSLEINPDDAYVLNYLAYSWLEREYKINTAMQMLEKAYSQKSNDPYIIDSIGWAYYLINDYLKAEAFLKRAVELMPEDPIVNDHYGDILWKLDRKLQAKYFWESVLNFETTEDDLKKSIFKKLLKGLKET